MSGKPVKYVALLRGIGPGNPNMRNDKLRAVFESLGLAHIQTVISSGNVLFESEQTDIPQLEATIEAALPEQLGFTSKAIIRNLSQLQALTAPDPFMGQEHSPKQYLTVTFLKHPQALSWEFPYQPAGKTYRLLGARGQTIFSVTDTTGDRAPDLMLWLEKQCGKEITTRTWKTVNRIIHKMTA